MKGQRIRASGWGLTVGRGKNEGTILEKEKGKIKIKWDNDKTPREYFFKEGFWFDKFEEIDLTFSLLD